MEPTYSLIAIGASTGGVEALHAIIPQLKPDGPPMIVALHIPPIFSERVAESLDRKSALHVMEAKDSQVLERGTCLVCPGGHQIYLSEGKGRYSAKILPSRPTDLYRPCVDILLHSLAGCRHPEKFIGVILTGMGRDGAKGLLAMRTQGALTIAQDQESSTVYGMPRAANEEGAAKLILPLEKIAQQLNLRTTPRTHEAVRPD